MTRPTTNFTAAIAATVAIATTISIGSPTTATAQAPATAPGAAAPAAPEMGVWIDDTDQGAVEIAPCEGTTKLCGRIVWLKAPVDAKGKPFTDGLNPDKSKRSQPICGLQVIGNLVRQKDGSYDAGWIYDPKTGDKFDLTIKMKSPDVLAVTGYVGIKLLSETFTWKRAPANPPLALCSTQAAAGR
jgi:uncharacterized protein (DUF2147 family)